MRPHRYGHPSLFTHMAGLWVARGPRQGSEGANRNVWGTSTPTQCCPAGAWSLVLQVIYLQGWGRHPGRSHSNHNSLSELSGWPGRGPETEQSSSWSLPFPLMGSKGSWEVFAETCLKHLLCAGTCCSPGSTHLPLLIARVSQVSRTHPPQQPQGTGGGQTLMAWGRRTHSNEGP